MKENSSQNKQIQALQNFRQAYIDLLEHWTHNRTDLNELKSISHYPFKKSFDELKIIEWTMETEKEIMEDNKND